MSTAQSGLFAPAAIANPEWPFGFSELLQLLRKRGRTILKIAAGVVLLTTLAVLVLPSRYSTTAVVMLDTRRNNVTGRSEVLSELPTDPASVQNQIQILTSRDLAAAVIDRLGLARDREFNPALSSSVLNLFAPARDAAAQRSAVVDRFLKHERVEAEGLSTAVSVTVWAGDPEKAARIDNALVDSYIASQIAQKTEAARLTTRWLGSRIAQLARQVQDGDAAVQSYKAANGLNDSGQGTQSLVDQQLSTINSQLIQARADLAQKEAANSHVRALMNSGRAAEVSQVVASPLIVQLRQQQAEAIRNAADIETRYGAKHPKRIAAESALRDLDSKIEQEAERIAGSVANDVAVARAQIESLENSLAAARAQSNVQNLARVKLRALEASAASTRAMYESFVTRLREAQDQESVTTPDARIISHASVPAAPSFPPRALMLAASIPAGLLLGLLCALIMERTSAALRSPNAANPRPIAAPVVAVVPGARDPDAADKVIAAPSAPFSRAVLGLADRLAAAPISSRPRTILVSGSHPQDGLASIAVGLARALALIGNNVVLVDADLTRSAAARLMGFGAISSGLTEVLRGGAPLSRAIANDKMSAVVVIGQAQPAASRKIDWHSAGARALFQHLSQSADFVIVHAPTHLDMLPLLAIAECVLFVGAAGDETSLERTARAFAPSAPHLGLVLAA